MHKVNKKLPIIRSIKKIWLQIAIWSLNWQISWLTKQMLNAGFFFTGCLLILWIWFFKKDSMWSRTESWRQVYRCPSKANAQLLRMWCIVHFSALHKGHAALVDSPHNFNKFGVINQFTDALRTNLSNDLLTFPQIRFFQERSKGSAVSDHFSQMR